MLSPERKRRLLEIGVFIMPIVLVQFAGVVLGTGAATEVEAADDGDEAPAAIAVTPRERVSWTEAELAAARRVRELAGTPIERSPMYRLVIETPSSDPVDPEPGYRPLDVVLNGIMESSTGAVALIDDRTYREGDSIRDGAWTVVEIRVSDRSVRFRHEETGATLTMIVP